MLEETPIRPVTLHRTIRAAQLCILLAGALLGSIGCAPLNTAPTAPPKLSYPETGLSADGRAALQQLTANTPAAAVLNQSAKAVLVFPNVIKGGFVVGAFHGEGVLFKEGNIAGYYNTSGGSYGLEAGVQSYGYAIFFMTDDALKYVDASQGWEIGVGPSIVVADAGLAKTLSTTTGRSDCYAFIFDQRGLMAGVGLQGSKVYRID